MGRRASRIAGIVIVLAALAGPAEAGETPRPNIILLLSDTHRADYLGTGGFEGDISPNLDALAASSAVFRRAVAPAPWTKPSIASIFTSLYPRTHRVVDHEGDFWKQVAGKFKTSALPDSAVTLAEVLKAGGYTTGAWIANGWITKGLGFAQGFDRFTSQALNTNMHEGEKLLGPAWDWVEQVRKKEKPFFIYVQFMDTHGPWIWSETDYKATAGSPSLSRAMPAELPGKIPRPRMARDIPMDDSGTTLPQWRAVYASRVRMLDRHIGEFLAKLKAAGLMESSILVFTSDHGEELFDHGEWGHSYTLYQEQVRVPLIIRPPGGLKPARTVERTVSLVDLMPTLLSAAGVKDRPAAMQGADLWPAVVSGGPFESPGLAFSSAVRQSPRTISVQNDEYELIWVQDEEGGRHKLFHLATDPAERENHADTRPEVVARMRKELDAHLEKLRKAGTLLEAEGTLTPEEIEKLRAIGYVD